MAGLLPPDDVDIEQLDRHQLLARFEAARIRLEDLDDDEGREALDELLSRAPARLAEWGIMPTVAGRQG